VVSLKEHYKLPTHCRCGIVTCLCLDKVTTTLTVFQIWYFGVDLCLSRCSESSALLKYSWLG
jgi:hypothetical protein